jgi:hypothetical protein
MLQLLLLMYDIADAALDLIELFASSNSLQ